MHFAFLPLARNDSRSGADTAARSAMIPIVTSSSTRVKPKVKPPALLERFVNLISTLKTPSFSG
jgi:hypothetical protein